MEKELDNDGNKTIIHDNHATITINNYSKTNDKAIECFIESEKLDSKNIADFIKLSSEIANKIIDLEKFKRETLNKKTKRKK